MSRLELEGLSHGYGETPVLQGLTLAAEAGALTALLGPSGCGKSTALRIAAGLLAPASGTVRIGGRDVTRIPPERRGAVMVFQSPHLFPKMSVAENVGFGLRMRRRPAAETARQVAAMLERTGLEGLGARRPAELSGGQAQRAALARALVLEPQVLLLDEPLSSLDAGLRSGMRALIRELQRETGTTTLVVTHDQAEAAALASHVALMLGGRIAQEGPPEEIYARPVSAEVARFFGAETFLPGHGRGTSFSSPVGPLALSAPAIGPGTLTIRPEAIRPGAGQNTLSARLVEAEFLGTATRLQLDVSGTILTALWRPAEAAGLSPGDIVQIHLPAENLWRLPSA
ncbi:ABC transporter ATP-binding protein [Pseudoroseicyclus tamaricis]|uniref:ABC transporter ATP-binding protein n=1 Tax=Pseudoroseicyclus tamaricis TaxID=2705421 RepID=A0A6B2JW90_9RHOB|nr:ABC transporter ATP-binding protein [Pseudoroseicyclus tamaricis]NDV02380.1 ABC transporter ATP-binding protein [Pseudoroseicyclus tamaricis]